MEVADREPHVDPARRVRVRAPLDPRESRRVAVVEGEPGEELERRPHERRRGGAAALEHVVEERPGSAAVLVGDERAGRSEGVAVAVGVAPRSEPRGRTERGRRGAAVLGVGESRRLGAERSLEVRVGVGRLAPDGSEGRDAIAPGRGVAVERLRLFPATARLARACDGEDRAEERQRPRGRDREQGADGGDVTCRTAHGEVASRADVGVELAESAARAPRAEPVGFAWRAGVPAVVRAARAPAPGRAGPSSRRASMTTRRAS